MASEGVVQREIWAAVGRLGAILFRLNSGRAWISNLGPGGVQRNTDGSVVVRAARPIALGMAYPNGDPVAGQLDLCGWTSIEITPDMVGRRVAVATYIDAKRSKGGKTSEQQVNFCDQLNKAGGIAGIANSAEAAVDIIESWKHRTT